MIHIHVELAELRRLAIGVIQTCEINALGGIGNGLTVRCSRPQVCKLRLGSGQMYYREPHPLFPNANRRFTSSREEPRSLSDSRTRSASSRSKSCAAWV